MGFLLDFYGISGSSPSKDLGIPQVSHLRGPCHAQDFGGRLGGVLGHIILSSVSGLDHVPTCSNYIDE